jgi:hypothetical protein
MLVSRSTSCLPDMSIASTLKTAQMKKKELLEKQEHRIIIKDEINRY